MNGQAYHFPSMTTLKAGTNRKQVNSQDIVSPTLHPASDCSNRYCSLFSSCKRLMYSFQGMSSFVSHVCCLHVFEGCDLRPTILRKLRHRSHSHHQQYSPPDAAPKMPLIRVNKKPSKQPVQRCHIYSLSCNRASPWDLFATVLTSRLWLAIASL